jgi:hypothetical protein
LVERLNGIEEVSGSNPLGSTNFAAASEIFGRRFLGKFVGAALRRDYVAASQIAGAFETPGLRRGQTIAAQSRSYMDRR